MSTTTYERLSDTGLAYPEFDEQRSGNPVAERYADAGEAVYDEVALALNEVMSVKQLAMELEQGTATPTGAMEFPELYEQNGGLITVTDLTPENSPHDQVRRYIKHDTQQSIGAFKLRGASIRCHVAVMSNPELRVLVASSAGNHGKGVAAYGQWYNQRAGTADNRLAVHVFCRDGASTDKVDGMKALGAAVHQSVGDVPLPDLEAASAAARHFSESNPAAAELVPPFDDTLVMAGQATQTMEILAQLSAEGVDLLAQPLVLRVAGGGFGMADGNAVLIDQLVEAGVLHPASRVIATQQQGGDSMVRACQTVDDGQEIPEDLFANPHSDRDLFDASNDGTAVRSPGELTMPLTYYLRQKGRLVVETVPKWAVSAVIAEAEDAGYALEPAGALPEAGQKFDRFNAEPRVEVCIRSGRNMSEATRADFLAGQLRDAEALRYRAGLAALAVRSETHGHTGASDTPGRLAVRRTLRVWNGPTRRAYVPKPTRR